MSINLFEDKKVYSESFSSMMGSDAWKMVEEFAKEEKKLSYERMDSKTMKDLSLSEIAMEIGLRKGIDKILRYADLKRSGA